MKPTRKNDWSGWVAYLEKRRKELCAEALGITEWKLPSLHCEYLCNLFLASISLRISGEDLFFQYRDTMKISLGKDIESAFSMAFDLTSEQREKYLKELGFVVGTFGQNKRRPKVKELDILAILIEYLVHEEWPTNKQICTKAKGYGKKISAKKISNCMESEGITTLSKETRGPKPG